MKKSSSVRGSTNGGSKSLLPSASWRRPSSDRSSTTFSRQSSRRSSRSKLMTVNPTSMFFAPEFDKSPQKIKFIENVLLSSFFFVEDFATRAVETKTDIDLSEVVSAFEEIHCPKDSYLYNQGDLPHDDDYMYIIYSGECGIFIDGKRLPEPSGTVRKESLIGDVAMINDTARPATVQALTSVEAFRLDRKSFNHFLFLEDVVNTVPTSRKSRSSSLMPPKKPKEKLQRELNEIDFVIDQVSGLHTKYSGDIIQPLIPDRKWLWTRWKGTIMQQAWKVACFNMFLCIVFVILLRSVSLYFLDEPVWSLMLIPDEDNPFVSRMLGLSSLW